MSQKSIVAFVPLPPPLAGPEIATQALLEDFLCPGLLVVRSNVRSNNEKRGKFDLSGVLATVRVLSRLALTCLSRRPETVYFLLSSSRVGFFRDLAIVLVSKLFGCKVIGHYHGGNFDKFYERAPRWYKQLIRFGMNQIDTVVVQADYLRGMFQKIKPKQKFEILYNGLPKEVLQVATKINNKRMVEGEITFLFLGHLCFSKGFYELIKAWEMLRQEKVKARLVVVGDPILNYKTQREFLSGTHLALYDQSWREIHAKISDFLGDPSRYGAEFKGVVSGEKKYKIFEECHVFVLPSYTEGFPSAVLEAMAFKQALLVSPVGALSEVLGEPDNALFVKPGDYVALASQMKMLLKNPQEIGRMGENNYRLATQKFSIGSAQKQFSQIVCAQA